RWCAVSLGHSGSPIYRKSRRCRLRHVINCVQSQLITDHQGTINASQCRLSVPPINASQCRLSVCISAAYQCQSVPLNSASQCRLLVPVSTAYQCHISVLPFGAHQ
ncbi:unnamed protein product, partial [Staurois parvus]